MYNLIQNLGIKSWSLRHIKTNEEVAAAIRKIGLSVVDVSGCHINYDDAQSQLDAIASYRSAGVRISGLGVVGLKNDEAFNRRFFEFSKKADCKFVSCSFPLDEHEAILKMLEALCEEYGVYAAIHNHGCGDWLGNLTALDYVIRKTGMKVGICLDTAWCHDAGGDPVEWLRKFGGRIYGIHFKDFIYNQKGNPSDVVVGDGILNLGEFLKVLSELPFNGTAVVEFEGANPEVMSERGVEAIRKKLP